MRAAELSPESAWADFVPSVLSHHGRECCTTARAWFMAMDRSMWRGEGGPAWISRKFPWGPSCWPLHWCDAMEAEELDCGAHQALSVEAFRARGIQVLPVQLVQRQESHHLAHWHGRWGAAEASPAWAREGAAYHEACATLADGRAEVWDATLGAWLSPKHREGVRSIAAVRIGGPAKSDRTVDWRGVTVPLGVWTPLG
ncbi:MAG: hypothetical protein ICV87_03965 [Gemmatimonadetes bacterium]|nr:hypothetical protein [Gemmatimonadota bacterium]